MNRRESFAAIISDPPRLLWVEDLGDNNICIGDRVFADSGLGRSIGFYDWLRMSSGTLVGVRTSFLLDSGVGAFRERLQSNLCVEWEERSFALFFSTDREYDAEKSSDQDFGFHRLLISSDGLLLLTYDVKSLAQSEIDYLMQRTRRSAM